MPRTIIISDELEERIQHACYVHIGQITYASPALDALAGLLADARDDDDHRAAKHHDDNAALAALIDPCTCGDPRNDNYRHHYNGSPCLNFHRVDL